MKNQGYVHRLQLQDVAAQETVVEFLARRFSHSTEEQWLARMENGEIGANDQVIKEDQPAINGVWLTWHRPGWLEEETPQYYEVLYQDAHLLAVDKPSGLPTLPGGGFLENTLLHLVQRDHEGARPLHRLGRGTSGIVLFAKTPIAASRLSQAWPQVTKRYLALATGIAKSNEYDITQPIGPVPHPRLGTVHAASAQGKCARSLARVNARQNVSTIFDVELLSGRPHQIRIHLASIGHPLVGDPVYAVGGGLLESPGLPSDLGYLLHAHILEFAHPLGKNLVFISAPPPDELATKA